MRCPRVLRNRALDAFLASVQDLGVLPLVVTDSHVEICGGREPSRVTMCCSVCGRMRRQDAF